MAAMLPLVGSRGSIASGCRLQGNQMQASPASCSAFCRGAPVLRLQARPCARARVGPLHARAAASTEEAEAEGWTVVQPQRLRLDNLSPQAGARKKDTRKGRGYGAGQGGSCGFGMRGQKSRSGTGAGSRPGFEGGQTPIYRQMPKLRGIAGGMPAGVKKFVAINLRQLSASGRFAAGEEVTLELLRERNLLNLSGRERDMPLKVLGDGELTLPLTIHATQFSGSARAKIEAAGGTIVEVPAKIKWSRALGKERKAAAEEEAAKNPKQPKARKA